MLACLLALLLGPPVEIDARGLQEPLASSSLPGQILERVLEAGHPLHPHATTRVMLQSDDGAVVVVVRTEDERWQERVELAGREPAVVGLDVAHRVVARLSTLTAPEPTPSEPAVQLDPSLSDDALRRTLLLALVERGLPVVPPGQDARWTACGVHEDVGTRIALGHDATACAQSLATAEPHARIDQALDHAWIRARWPQGEDPDEHEHEHEYGDTHDSDEREGEPGSASLDPEVPTDRPPRSEPNASTSRTTPKYGRPPLETTVSADVGPSVRPPVDLRIGGTVAVGRSRGPTGVFELAVLPSRGEADLRVVDVIPAIGAAWRIPLAERWRLVPGVVAGVRLHTHRFPDEPPRARVDVHVAIPMHVQWKLRPRLSVGLRVAAAFDGRARQHRVNGLDAWRRGPWRLDLGLTLGVALGRIAPRPDTRPSTHSAPP